MILAAILANLDTSTKRLQSHGRHQLIGCQNYNNEIEWKLGPHSSSLIKLDLVMELGEMDSNVIEVICLWYFHNKS